MKLLMISGDRTLVAGKASAFSAMMEEFHTHFERIDIICPKPTHQGQNVLQVFGNVHIHPATGGLLSQPFFIKRKGKELFRQFAHDVMTVHEYPPFYNGIGARFLKKKIGIPAVLELHHIIGYPKAASFSEFIGRWMTKFFIGGHSRHFSAVRVVNETVKTRLSEWGVPVEKMKNVPSVYLDHSLLMSSKHSPKKYDATFCSRLVDNKGLPEVIEAFARLDGATLRIIGDGPLCSSSEMLVKNLGLEDRVTFAGWLPDAAAVAREIASGKVFLMNSKSEGNPRVAIEAMALGLPVLTTRVGIMPDVVREGENGMFTTGKPKDIAEKLKLMLADSAKLAAMGAAASGIAARFEKKAAIKAYADFLMSQVH